MKNSTHEGWGGVGNLGFYALAAVLVFAPLVWGGNVPLPRMVLQLAAVALAAHALWRPDFQAHLSRPLIAALAVLFVIPLLQSIPLPAGVWGSLPGHGFYAEALRQVNGESPFTGLRAASLVPFETQNAWLTLLPPLAVFLVAVGLPADRLQALVIVFLGVAGFQAILGLIQYGDGPGSIFYLGNPHMGGSAAGTYINRNHLAGLLEMALPMGLALLMASVGRFRRHSRGNHRRSLRHRLARLGTLGANQAALYGGVAIAILLGLIFTRSRTGVSLAMLGILLCTLAFSRRLGGNNVYGLYGTVTAITLALAIEVGLAPVLDRFTLQDSLSNGRWTIFDGTLQAIGEFFPMGSGLGSFVEVFPRFHPEVFVSSTVVNRAHNDYLEWTMGGGLAVPVLLAVMLVIYLRQWPRVWTRDTWPTFRFLQVGAGIALLLMLLHGLVDFNLHIPANAIFFAFLAAVFFHRYPREKIPMPSPKQPREQHRKLIKAPPPQSVPPENAVNPFDLP